MDLILKPTNVDFSTKVAGHGLVPKDNVPCFKHKLEDNNGHKGG